MAEHLQPADIFLTRGDGLISRAIRFFTRSIGEARTKVNHVGIVVEGGPVEAAVVVEALAIVRRHPLVQQYSGKRGMSVAVYRALNLTDAERQLIVDSAERYVGRKYGYLKLLAHFADWALLGAYVFRRLARMENYPICSWLVAHAYAKAEKLFGIEPGAATPDDIWDFVTGQPEKYIRVRPLEPL